MPRHLQSCLLGLCLVAFAGLGASAQVVNIERQRLEEGKPGWLGSVAANANLQRNQRSVFTLGADAHAQYRRDSSVYLLLTQTGLVKTSDSPDLVNFAFGHFRFTHLFTERWSSEAFTQLQQNRVNGIASRWLIGAGGRARIVESDPITAFTGVLLMREREAEVTDSIPVRRDWRLSTYLALSYTPNSADWISVATTTYVQPRLGDFKDLRVSSDWSLEVRLRENLALTTTFSLQYDARPPVGLESVVYGFFNGVKFSFE